MENLKVNGNYAKNQYVKVEENTSNDSKPAQKKSSEPIPVGKPVENNDEKPMTGLVLEHKEDANDDKPEDKNEKDASEKNNTSNKTDSNSTKSVNKNNLTREKFNDSNNSLNDSYRNLLRKNVGLRASDTADGTDLTNNNLTEALEDIDNAGKEHIRNLQSTLPDDGLLSGSVSFTHESSEAELTETTYVNINNSWQNKKKNFGIFASGTLNYEKSISKIENTDVPEVQNNQTDTGNNDYGAFVQNETNTKNFSGNFSLNARYDTKDVIVGGGVSATFYNDEDKMYDIFVTGVHKPSKIGFDLTRRTIKVKDSESGESVSKSKMKLKVDIIDRKSNNDEFEFDNPIKPHEVSLPSESNEEIQKANEENNKIKNLKAKNGSGIDVDFEYDDTKCGVLVGYGVNLVNNPKTATRLTVAPVLGLYSYSEADESDAAKITFGGNIEFKKIYPAGQRISADLSVINDRIAAQGSKPVDAFYTIFSGSYTNPRAKLSTNLDAGYIKSGSNSIAYVEGNIGYQIKDFNIGVKGGYSTASGEEFYDEHTTQIGASVTYTIPYKTRK